MSSLSSVTGIGPQITKKLHNLGINSSQDFLYHLPHRYADFSKTTPINQVETNSSVTITGEIVDFKNIFTRYKKNIQIATVADSTGKIKLIWFNQPYLSKKFITGQKHSFAGPVSLYQGKPTIINAMSGEHNTGKIIAVYHETKGLTSNWIRKIISQNIDHFLEEITDNLPPQKGIPPLRQALREVHLPTNHQNLEAALLRIGLDEIISLQSQSILAKQQLTSSHPTKILYKHKQIQHFIKSLPFSLTPSQIKVWQEIYADLTSKKPTNRLLQGDVGSGKTIIAVLACLLSSLNKTQSLVIAPTEILAQQHFKTFKQLLQQPVILLTAKHKPKNIPPDAIIIATHAAINHKVTFQDQVGLVIIDEQHKFGVKQRTFLMESNSRPHYLTMTATPIPRTIALTIMGNLDLSVIEAPPSNRIPIKTYIVPPSKQPDCYSWLTQKIVAQNQQAFVVCPFIEPSETLQSVKSATETYQQIKSFFPKEISIGLIHGKMPEAERQKVIAQFGHNKIHVLVSTPIIEVGIDFPNATTIIIYSAERFGLAQLHQLRGRVGRSNLQSFCYLFSESSDRRAQDRLKVIANNHNGQEIAQADLKLRGPGEAFSLVQHGFPSFKVASFSDYHLINLGQKIIKNIQEQDPQFDFNKLIHHHSTIHVTN